MNREELNEVAYVISDFSKEQRVLLESVLEAEEKLLLQKEKETSAVVVEKKDVVSKPKRKSKKKKKKKVEKPVPVVENVEPVQEEKPVEVPATETVSQ